ncbi:MAG: metallophosphoesterase [Eubacteriales bacterium]|nr:metallophosphoesterase [Eubacteriales bacterium]
MALYAMGDFHLAFQSDKSMNKFGSVWRKHEEKIQKYCSKLIRPEDTLVITGDHSWGKDLETCREDLAFIEGLPGRKILLRGNHDMFWDAKKTEQLNREYQGRLEFLQNNYYAYEDYALVGTKGYTFEGPFYLDRRGRIMGWDEDREKHAEKLIKREMQRLQQSFDAAWSDGYRKFLMFLHYPPTSILEEESAFTRIAEKYGAEHVIYSHCHGESRFHDSIRGEFHGIQYHLVSGDCLKFRPEKIM